LDCLLYPYGVDLSNDIDHSDLIISKGRSQDSKDLIRASKGPSREGSNATDNGSGVIEFPFGPVKVCSGIFSEVMNPRLSLRYKLATRIPSQYNIVPSPIRSLLLRMSEFDSDLSNHLTTEVARKILRNAFNALGFPLRRKSPPSLMITHDIETRKGLGKALRFKKVEDDLGVHSTWFLCSHEYPIPKDIAKDLGADSTIGSHDSRHDGKLIHIRAHEKLVHRLSQSRERLEQTFEKRIESFRSPLLQFSRNIAKALGEAGYCRDFSIPCWEPVHPATMTGFGVESVQEFQLDGLVEIPLTLFQDHQLLNVLGLRPQDAVKLWVEQAKKIHSLDGNIVLLVHPDFAFSQNLHEYRKLLGSLLEIQAS
jgi:hypothetical protein